MNNSLVVVATDAGPSSALARVHKATNCLAFLGNGKLVENLDGVTAAVIGAKAVLVGMSSSEKLASPELLAVKAAISAGVPVGLYCDAPGCHRRPWFSEVRENIRFLTIINESEKRDAQELFPNAVIEATGNPDWDKYFFIKTTRQEVRLQLGIADDDKMIFVSGHKVTVITLPLIVSVLEAVAFIQDLSFVGHPWNRLVTILGLHPGAGVPFKEYSGLHYAGAPVKVTVRKQGAEVQGTPVQVTALTEEEMIVGSDLVIGACATAEVGAACQRVPAIAFMTQITLGRNPEIFGEREWEWARQRTSLPVYAQPDELADTMQDLLDDTEIRSQLLVRQKEVFPRPEREGIALEKIVALCQRFTKLTV